MILTKQTAPPQPTKAPALTASVTSSVTAAEKAAIAAAAKKAGLTVSAWLRQSALARLH